MGKKSKAKSDLMETNELSYVVQSLKDVADNKYYNLINEKDTFKRFGESFIEFFRLINLTAADHPLISNEQRAVGIVVVTIEGTFLSGFNNKIIDQALKEKEKYSDAKFIVIGRKAIDRLKIAGPDLKIFPPMDEEGMYETSIAVKDYLIESVMKGDIGKVVVCYAWPKSFEIQKLRAVKLLPCDELVSKQAQMVDVIEDVIEESDPKDVIGYLSNLWVTTRLYEMFIDTNIASAAAQANLLEDSTERMKKERRVALMRYRKAKKMDIDKGLRETYSGQMMAVNKN